MRSGIATILVVVLMAAVIIVVDVSFLRNRPWLRLAVNVGIVLVFAVLYFRFVKGR